MSRPKLQLALDFVRLDAAASVAELSAPHVDCIEVGTPLIKACGLDAVRRLKRRFPSKHVVADMKTMDTGRLEAEQAYRAGADATTVLGVAARETIRGAVEAAHEYGRQVIVDSIGAEDTATQLHKIDGLAVNWLLIHTGIDQQRAGHSAFSHLDAFVGSTIGPRLGLVGGIDAETIVKLSRYPRVELVIVGGAITNAADPSHAAARIRAALDALPAVS